MSLIESVARQTLQLWPGERWVDSSVVAAVSGGSDSVALVRVLDHIIRERNSEGQLTIAHCDHAVRPDSEQDAKFVRHLAGGLGWPFIGFHRDPETTNSEESLRRFRYDSLVKAAQQVGARYIVTGHTADDQVETILFRIFRGTGISGLAGIPAIRVDGEFSIVRPLLKTRRHQLTGLLKEIGQSWCEDESNRDDRYARNFLRRQIIPRLSERFNQLESSLSRLADQASDQLDLLDRLAAPIAEQAETKPGLVAIPKHILVASDRVIALHAARKIWRSAELPEQQMTADSWNRLVDYLLDVHQPNNFQLPGYVEVSIDGNQILIEGRNRGQIQSS